MRIKDTILKKGLSFREDKHFKGSDGKEKRASLCLSLKPLGEKGPAESD